MNTTTPILFRVSVSRAKDNFATPDPVYKPFTLSFASVEDMRLQLAELHISLCKSKAAGENGLNGYIFIARDLGQNPELL